MFLVGFELILYDGKMRNWSQKQDGDAGLKTITFFTMYSVVNMVLGNIWPLNMKIERLKNCLISNL